MVNAKKMASLVICDKLSDNILFKLVLQDTYFSINAFINLNTAVAFVCRSLTHMRMRGFGLWLNIIHISILVLKIVVTYL